MNDEDRKHIEKEEAYLDEMVKELETELGTKRRRRINPLWILLLVLLLTCVPEGIGVVLYRMLG